MAAAPPATNEALPASIGRYRPVRRLGKGGMAEVFLADIVGPGGFSRRVALKTVLPMHSENPDVTRMFLDEARVAAHFTHPNLVQVYDFGEIDGRYFMAMEYARGLSLRALIRQLKTKRSRMPDVIVAALGSHCCAALAYAHALVDDAGEPMKIVHRDVTPENIFLTVDGVAKVLDFGIARSQGRSENTEVGVIKGKPAYMSPEQAAGKEVDGRSDVFSLGCTLWEALTTHRLFSAPDTMAILIKVMTEPIPDLRTLVPDCGEALAAVVMASLERKREDRPTASELQAAFDGLIQQSAHSNPQLAIAGFLKGSVPSTPLSAVGLARPVSSPGTSPGTTSRPGESGSQSTPGTPIEVESMHQWPIPATSITADETMLVDPLPAEWGATEEIGAAPLPSDLPPPVQRPVPGAVLSTFRGSVEDEGNAAPVELNDHRVRVEPTTLAVISTPTSTAASIPVEDLASEAPADAPFSNLWIAVAGVFAAVLLGAGWAWYSRPPPPEPPKLTPAPITVPMSFATQPPGATIELDGADTGHVTPATVEAAVFEEHTWALTLKDYQRVEGKAAKDHLSVPISATLVAPFELSASSTPPGAAIECDGAKVIDETPGKGIVGRGEHLLRANLEGYVPVEQKQVVDEAHPSWSVSLQPAAYLDIHSDPAGAKIVVDGVLLSEVAPAAHVAVLAGQRHVVELSQDNLRASQRIPKTAAGKTVNVTLRLVDPVVAAKDARRAGLVAKEKVLEDEKERLEKLNNAFILSGPNETREYRKREKRVEAIDQEIDAVVQQMSELGE